MDYVSAKKSLAEIKKDIKQRPLKTLGILFIVLFVFISTGALYSFITGYISKTTDSSFIPVKNIYRPPQLELTYTKQSENKNLEKNGAFETEFLLSINQPPGNYQLGFKINTNISNAECSNPESLKSETMTVGAIASSTFTYRVKCTSYQPIIDNKKLFSIK